MVTTVADTLFQRLSDAFPADRAYGVPDFTRDPMPETVREHLRRRLARRVDDLVSPHGDWIDAEHPDVRKAAQAYLDALSRHLQIPAPAWREELRRACRTIAAYLIRPGSTLTDRVFDDDTSKADLERIGSELHLLPAYGYFGEVIAAYFEQKGLDEIDRERFAGLVRRIDEQMTRDFGAEEWLKLLEPLLDLVRRVPEFTGGIPVGVLKEFVLEKGADRIAARLDALEAEGKRFVRESDLSQVFKQSAAEAPPAEPPARKPVEQPTESSHRQEGPVPLWKQFESGKQAPQKAAPTSGDSGPATSTEPQPLWKQFRSPADAGTSDADDTPGRSAAPDDDLAVLERSVLGDRGPRNRGLFVKHLFSGSTDSYTDTLRQLRSADSWSDASQIIAREVFLKHQVNIYSDPAVAFTDAAEAKYRS